MKFLRGYIIIILCLSTLLVSAKGFKITGKADSLKDGTRVILFEMLGPEIAPIQTTEVKKGSFSFKVAWEEKGFLKIGTSEKNSGYVVADLNNLEVEVPDKDFTQLKVSDSKENDLYVEYTVYNDESLSLLQRYQEDANAARKLNASNPRLAQEIFTKAKNGFDSTMVARQEKLGEFASNENTIIGGICEYILAADTIAQDEFFDSKVLGQKPFQRSELYVVLASVYVQRFYARQPEGVQLNAAIEVIQKQKENSKERELLYLSFCHALATTVNGELGAKLGRNYKTEYPESPYQKSFLKKLPALPLGVGDMAPEIAFPNPDGEIMKLSDTKGKVVLLDFWASWCRPCRMENPNVVKAYKKYRDKGFTVFSVSLDKAKPNWERAIAKDGLEWSTHVSDLKGWSSEPAKMYGVRGIPAAFLLDENGVIVAKNLRGGDLEKKLKELLGDKK